MPVGVIQELDQLGGSGFSTAAGSFRAGGGSFRAGGGYVSPGGSLTPSAVRPVSPSSGVRVYVNTNPADGRFLRNLQNYPIEQRWQMLRSFQNRFRPATPQVPSRPAQFRLPQPYRPPPGSRPPAQPRTYRYAPEQTVKVNRPEVRGQPRQNLRSFNNEIQRIRETIRDPYQQALAETRARAGNSLQPRPTSGPVPQSGSIPRPAPALRPGVGNLPRSPFTPSGFSRGFRPSLRFPRPAPYRFPRLGQPGFGFPGTNRATPAPNPRPNPAAPPAPSIPYIPDSGEIEPITGFPRGVQIWNIRYQVRYKQRFGDQQTVTIQGESGDYWGNPPFIFLDLVTDGFGSARWNIKISSKFGVGRVTINGREVPNAPPSEAPFVGDLRFGDAYDPSEPVELTILEYIPWYWEPSTPIPPTPIGVPEPPRPRPPIALPPSPAIAPPVPLPPAPQSPYPPPPPPLIPSSTPPSAPPSAPGVPPQPIRRRQPPGQPSPRWNPARPSPGRPPRPPARCRPAVLPAPRLHNHRPCRQTWAGLLPPQPARPAASHRGFSTPRNNNGSWNSRPPLARAGNSLLANQQSG
ncbi:hypothetical protein HNI00_07285 [Thermoleptolyngbya oregonensis NK1-22]|uniref:Uncharacterized protein n=1 Tax=Thermoleptolyngbya oregonensis NK1-22 TaxID=2547457 RepID=A0AA96Y5G7_9CYAN|nr:hypothetical protein [Thermoleptolyngbya oregonensis]WOB42979.1 hypothetical protein HNI00_07285 [Thermoleptolyngbya oregonensis NK1-22]